MRSEGTFSAILSRLGLLTVVIAGTAVLLASLVLPSAMAVTEAVDTVRNGVLDVGPLPSEPDAQPENSFIYASDGSLLAEILFEESRNPVALEDIPEVAIHAVLATEDADFYAHNGVNYSAMARAAVTNLQAGGIEQGGSTITQQYIENAYLGRARTFDLKITESLWAIELERRLTKDQILEGYLNTVYFGSGVYGIGTAAERYFSKDVGELTLSGAAMLAGIIRLPEGNNPVDDAASAQQRRDVVLDQMALNNFVTREQAEAAKVLSTEELLKPRPPRPPAEPFWTSWITELLTDGEAAEALGTQVEAFDAMGVTSEARIARVFSGGLRIHTTLDPALQDIAEKSIRQHLTYEDEPRDEIAREPFGAIVSVEPGTGAIRTAAVGPRRFGTCDPEDGGKWVGVTGSGRLLCDRTTVNPIVPAMGGSGRQPGSSFKPFVIAAALESGVPPGWQVEATGPQTIPKCDNGGPWEVNNSGGDGLRDMYSGVAGSSNVFHARLIREIGPEAVVEMAGRFGFDDLPAECSLALGAAEVFPLEMATAFAALANRGAYCEPFPITRIEDAAGNVLYEHSPRCEQVIDRDIVDRVVDIMAGTVESGGTAPGANLEPYPTRGKTGTTQSYVDAWFVGYIKQLATAAWIGYPNGVVNYESDEQAIEACPDQHEGEQALTGPICIRSRTLEDVTIGGQYYDRVFGATIPAPMWTAYMEQAVERFDPKGFPDPGPLPRARIPDLLDASSIAEAEDIAEEAGFNLVVEEVSDYRPAGTFLGQDPDAGTEEVQGRAIVLAVSDGTGEPPVVPQVVGLTQREAERVLTGAGYDVSVENQEVGNERRIGRVLAQSPEAGSILEPGDGATVAILVGVRAPDPPPEPPGDGNGGGDGDGGGDGGGGGGDGGGGDDGGGGGGGGGGKDNDRPPDPPDDGDDE